MNHRVESPQALRISLALKAQLRSELAASKAQQKAVAFEIGVDPATVSRWLSDEHHEAMPAWVLMPWTREAGAETLAYIARHVGYELVPTSGLAASAPALPVLTGALSAQTGKLVQLLIQALEDGKLDARECAALQPDLFRLRATLDGIGGHCGGAQ